MKIYLAFDHAGYSLKEALKPFLVSLGHEVEDCGAHTLDPNDDYPDFIRPCAEKVAANPGSFGIIGGASGQGEAMVANRVPGARAAVFYGSPQTQQTDASGRVLDIVQSPREHQDANILSLGFRFCTEEEAKTAVRHFLETPFPAEARHVRRIEKLG